MKRWNSIEKVFSFKTWFKMYFGIGHDSKEFQDYLNSTTEFYRALQFHSKKEIVVDISKNPLRAWALEKNPNIDLRMVHLVRDGRAVAWSLKKNAKEQNRKRPTWRAAMFWVIINRMTDLVRNKVENKVLIKYEDLISDPASVLNQIESMSDVDLSSIIDKIDRNDDFKIEHVMAGNAIRKADTIKFQTSKADGWKNKLKPFDNNLFKCISINSLKKFSYL